MIENSNKKVIKNYFPMIILSLSIWVILLRIGLKDGTDDTAHIAYLSQYGVLKWIYNRIITWQPCIFSDLTYALLINNLSIWRIFNSIVLFVLMFSISKISVGRINDDYKLEVNSFACCLFYFISPYVIISGVMWYSGSPYLWLTTAMIVSIIPFYYEISRRPIVYKNLNIIFWVTTIYASYSVQQLAIIFCFSTICIVYLKICRRKVNKELIIQYILIILNGAIFYVLSQIGDRITKEVHWYVGFDMLSFIDKLFQGINWTNYHYINSSNILMLILSIELFLIIRNIKPEIKILSMIPMTFFMLRVIPLNALFSNFNINNSNVHFWTGKLNPYMFEEVLYNHFYDTAKIMPNNMFSDSIFNFLPSYSGFFIMLFISILLWVALPNKDDKISIVSLYFAALVSGYVLGFSPTIIASGNRIFFVGNILILLITVKLFYEILHNDMYYYKWEKYIFIVLAMLMWLQYATHFASGILWL